MVTDEWTEDHEGSADYSQVGFDDAEGGGNGHVAAGVISVE